MLKTAWKIYPQRLAYQGRKQAEKPLKAYCAQKRDLPEISPEFSGSALLSDRETERS